MGVYIKGMEMPRTCYECWALDDDYDYPMCRITQEQRGYDFDTRGRKMDKCPLTERPEPHCRLIDEDEILNALRRIASMPWGGDYNEVRCGACNFDDAILEIRNVPSEDVVHIEVYRELYKKYVELKHELEQPQNDNWIPVSERLPSDGDDVLCTDKTWNIRHCGFHRNVYRRRHVFLTVEEGRTVSVIAWKPLPTPYKGGDDE